MNQRTLVILKPDAVQRGLIGEIISRIERKGLVIENMRMFGFDRVLLGKHYQEHIGKDFYGALVEFMESGPCVAVLVFGYEAIKVMRMLAGPTAGANAVPGTIRGDFASGSPIRENLVHASDSPEASQREITLFFPEA